MNVYVNETEEDQQLWFELWKSASLEELRIKCAIYGVDTEKWLKTDGYLWIPRGDGREVLWHSREVG